jgi:hypothetical protein
MEDYYNTLLKHLDGYTVMGLFEGKRNIKDIVTLQTGNQGRVFFFDQEPMIKGIDNALWDYIFQEPTIFANSELDSADKEYVKAKYPNFVDWYFFSHGLVSREWFSRYKNLRAGWTHQKHFLADFGLVTGPRQYRLYLFFLCYNSVDSDWEKFFHVSYNANQNWKEDLLVDDRYNLLNLDYSKVFPSAVENNEFIYKPHELFSMSLSYDNYGKDSLHGNSLKQTVIPIEKYQDVNYVIVSETVFEESKKHLTEKIFKPIAVGKPFILAGGIGNLEYLKSYGFKTFGDLWSETYDQVHNSKERIETIFREVFTMIEFDYGEKAIDVFSKAHEIAEHNRKHFWSQEFYNLLIQEAVDNLECAKLELSSKNI